MSLNRWILILVASASFVGCGKMTSSQAALEAANAGKFNKVDRPACEIHEVEYALDTKMVSFEMTSSGGLRAGFNALTGFLQMFSLDFKAKSGSMTMSMTAYDPMSPDLQLSSALGAGSFYSFGFGLDLGLQSIGLGFSGYHQTPLAKLAEKSLTDTFENLSDDLTKLQDKWNTDVVAVPDENSVVIPVGSFGGLKVGDIMAIYNVEHVWKGTPCKSQYMIGRKSPEAPVAYGQITDLAKNAAVLRLVESEIYPRNRAEKIIQGAKVEMVKFVDKARTLYRTMQIRSVVGASISYEGGQSVDISPHLKDQIDAVAHRYGFMVYSPK